MDDAGVMVDDDMVDDDMVDDNDVTADDDTTSTQQCATIIGDIINAHPQKNTNPSYPSPPGLSHKKMVVSKYVQQYMEGVKQGSADWLVSKRKTIGGSEMACLDGSSIFKGVKELIESKVGITKWNGDYRTHWGNLFEDVITTYIEHDKNTEILGTEIWIPGRIPRQSYSPDGLGVMMVNTEIDVVDKLADGTETKHTLIVPEEKIVLFEFKCPFSRSPGPNVPKWYIPQVKSGLDTIPCAEIGLYAEASFRRCCYLDLQEDNDEFTPTFNAKTRCGGRFPLAFGFIGFYFDPIKSKLPEHRQDVRKMLKYYQDEESVGVVDAGEVPDELFEVILRAFINGVLIPYHSEIIYRGEQSPAEQSDILQRNYDAFFEHCAGRYRVCCILPWKMFNIGYHFIDKEPGYLDQFVDQINAVMDTVDAALADPDNRDAIVSNHFASIDAHFDD